MDATQGPKPAGVMGQKELDEMQQRWTQSPVPGEG